MPLKARLKRASCPKGKWEKQMDWIKDRVSERTSWDGAVIIAVCALVLFTGGLAKILAVAGLAYGAWTCWKEE